VPEVILPKLRQVDLTEKIGAWLALPQTAPMVADWIITILKRLLAAGHSAQINEFIQHTIGQQLRSVDLAPLLGRAIEILTTSEESDVLFEKAVEAAERWIAANRTQLDEMVEQRRPWWIPRTIDRRIAAAIVDGTIDLLRRLRQRDSEVRLRFRAALTSMADDLMTSAEQRGKIKRLKNLLLDDTEMRVWIASAWDGLSHRLMLELSDRSRMLMRHFIPQSWLSLIRCRRMHSSVHGSTPSSNGSQHNCSNGAARSAC
jgi:uncharacterized membrane-anchored protein YjiN (DUF445 family)